MGRIWKEDEIKTLVQTNDKVLYGALMQLYECQTEDEKSCGATNHTNGKGFNGVDAPILTSFAKFLKECGRLSEKQKEISHNRDQYCCMCDCVYYRVFVCGFCI